MIRGSLNKKCYILDASSNLQNLGKYRDELLHFFLQNIFVSYDMEHFEEDEDRVSYGKSHLWGIVVICDGRQ